MNVCFIKPVSYPPVMGIEFYEHPQQLAKLGNRVCVISMRREGEVKKENIGDVEVYRIEVPADSRFRDLFFVLKASRFLSQHKFDIVHVYAFGKCFILPLLGKLFLRNRVNGWVHNILQVNTVGGMRGFLQNKKAKFASYFFDAVIVSDNREDSEIKRRILGDNFSKPCFLAAVGTNVMRHNYISEETINELRYKYDIKQDQVILMYIGSISPLRNLSVLIRAFRRVSDRFDNARLFFVGNGSDMIRLVELSQRLEISNKVIFTGYIDYNKIPEYLQIADIGISYIPINDFLDCQPPLKTMEYLAAGLPVIATNTTGNRLFVKHEYNGLLTGDDETDLAQAMTSLIADAKLRQQLARNSRGSVKHLDWMLIAKDQLLPAYKTILNRPK